MHPILFHIGDFSLKSYGLLVATGFLAGIAVAVREARRLGHDTQIVLDLAFYMIIGAIVGSRLFYVATHFSYYQDHLLDIVKVWQGGLTFFGGFLMALAIFIWILKRRRLPLGEFMDIFAPALAIGVFFGRLGCFAAGCCYGKPCDLPWAVTFKTPDSLAPLFTAIHPTQLYSATGGLITFIVLYALRTHKAFTGQLALLWVIMYSGIRTVNELFRGDVRGDLLFGQYPTSQVLAWCLLAGALIAYPLVRRHARRTT